MCQGDARSPISRPFPDMDRARDFVRRRIAAGTSNDDLYVSVVHADGTTDFTYLDEKDL